VSLLSEDSGEFIDSDEMRFYDYRKYSLLNEVLMFKRKQPEKKPTNKICDLPPGSEALKILAGDPAYFCRECGRTAASDENLCQSEPMFNAW
jgi:hypothetical protein